MYLQMVKSDDGWMFCGWDVTYHVGILLEHSRLYPFLHQQSQQQPVHDLLLCFLFDRLGFQFASLVVQDSVKLGVEWMCLRGMGWGEKACQLLLIIVLQASLTIYSCKPWHSIDSVYFGQLCSAVFILPAVESRSRFVLSLFQSVPDIDILLYIILQFRNFLWLKL